ncbi:hypothetical protein FRC03_009967 [Tulasnella sp. 419]|nr:hypothetical protein FRC03_009967 [Tulasnella sp. 419]
MLLRRTIISFFFLAGALLSKDDPKTQGDNVLPQEWPSDHNIAVKPLWEPGLLTLPAGPVKETKQAITASSFVDITTILAICHADTLVAEHSPFLPVEKRIAPPAAEEEDVSPIISDTLAPDIRTVEVEILPSSSLPPKDSSDPGPAVKDKPRWITRLRYFIQMIKNNKILACLELGFSVINYLYRLYPGLKLLMLPRREHAMLRQGILRRNHLTGLGKPSMTLYLRRLARRLLLFRRVLRENLGSKGCGHGIDKLYNTRIWSN